MEERQGEPITLFRLHVYSRERERIIERESQKEEEERKKERRVRSWMKRDDRERESQKEEEERKKSKKLDEER